MTDSQSRKRWREEVEESRKLDEAEEAKKTPEQRRQDEEWEERQWERLQQGRTLEEGPSDAAFAAAVRASKEEGHASGSKKKKKSDGK